MSAEGIIVWLIIGAIAGWLAGALVKGGGFGLIGDIVVGIVGALIGGWLADALGISTGSGFIASNHRRNDGGDDWSGHPAHHSAGNKARVKPRQVVWYQRR